jgi:hypothetical protein
MSDGPLPESAVVRVVRLRQAHRHWLSSEGVGRPPEIGDRGAIVHVYAPGDPATPYIVECVDGDGLTIWLADFDRDEIESTELRA